MKKIKSFTWKRGKTIKTDKVTSFAIHTENKPLTLTFSGGGTINIPSRYRYSCVGGIGKIRITGGPGRATIEY
jgi:hypothetical protein